MQKELTDKPLSNQLVSINDGLVLATIFLAFSAGFIARFTEIMEKGLLVLFFAIGLYALLVQLMVNQGKKLSKEILILLVVLVIAFGYSVVIMSPHSFLLEAAILSSNLLPLLLVTYMSSNGRKRALQLIIAFSTIQLFVDLFLPDLTRSAADMHPGTFLMANNKARYLLFILMFLFIAPIKMVKEWAPSYLIKIFIGLIVTASFILGFSTFSLMFGAISIMSAVFFRRFYMFVIANVAALYFMIQYLIKNIASFPGGFILYNYNRYFHEEHGVVAVYNYGWEVLSEGKLYAGVGLGNFITRSAQLLGSTHAANVPRTMITYGTIYEDTVAPPGVSSLFVFLVELGVLALPLFYVLYVRMKKFRSKSVFGFFSFFYLLYLINYSPMFFEFNECLLLFLTFYLTNKFISDKQSLRSLAK